MKNCMSLALGITFLACMSVVAGEKLKSGLQPGKFIGPFYVTKCGGADEDGVKVGDNLCYRCKYGGRPQVMVFARSSDEKVMKLVQGLDAAVKTNSKSNLRAFVNLIGKDEDALTEEAKKLAKSSKSANVPVVVPNENENGPNDYGINPDAAVTVILAGGGEVRANHAVATTKDLNVKAILADIKKIVKK